MNMRSLFLMSVLAFAALPASATEMRTAPRAVVELFTSQGCSSCPPADAILSEIGARKDIIALAYHVDYWDYIGWRDTFGSPAYSTYQRNYASARHEPRVYTPQLMVNGQKDVVGSRRGEVNSALSEAALPITLDLMEKDGLISISAKGNVDFSSAQLWLVTFKKTASVAIGRGENRNKTLEYSHIVTSRQLIGMWDRDEGVSLKLPINGLLGDMSDGAAILIQQDVDGLPGPILGATSFLR